MSSDPETTSTDRLSLADTDSYGTVDSADVREKDPRACFISLFYLFKNWTDIPFSILFDSIIILYCRREWLFAEDNSIENTQLSSVECRLLSTIQSLGIPKSKEFLTFVTNKESQKRLLFIDPKYDSSIDGTDIRWFQISDFLKNISNPITNEKFHSTIIDSQFWTQKFLKQFKLTTKAKEFKKESNDIWQVLCPIQYCSHDQLIKSELQLMKWKWRPVLEILVQSNPTMIPMLNYESAKFNAKKEMLTIFKENASQLEVKDALSKGWKMKVSLLMERTDGMVFLK